MILTITTMVVAIIAVSITVVIGVVVAVVCRCGGDRQVKNRY